MTAKPPSNTRRRRWLVIAGGFVLLLVIGWFVLTSGPAVKAVVLPRVASALKADLSVEGLQLSPFSSLELSQVRLAPSGAEPLAEIAGVKVRYSLFQLLGGKLAIHEIELDQPRFTIRQRPDGGSDLTDWLAKLKADAAQPAAGSPDAGGPPQLQIGPVTVRNGSARMVKSREDGTTEIISLESLQLTVDQIHNGSPVELKFNATPVVEFRDPARALTDSIRAALELSVKASLDQALMPDDIDSKLRLATSEATGRFARGEGLAMQLDARGSLAKLDEFALRFLRDTNEVGRVQLTGGYDVAQGRGAFELGVFKLPPIVLELAAARSGLNFELADFASTNHIVIDQGGQTIQAAGGLQLSRFTAANEAGTSPVIDLLLNYDAEIDQSARRALIRALTFTARQNNRPLAELQMPKPFHFSWSGQPAGEAGSALAFQLTDFNLGEWRPLTGGLPLEGVLAAQLNLEAREQGRHLAFNLASTLERGGFILGTNRLGSLAATVALAGDLNAQRELQIASLNARLNRAGKSVVEVTGSGQAGLSNFTASATTTLKCELAPLAGWVTDLPVAVSSGVLTLTSTVHHAVAATSVQGTVVVDALSMGFQGARFDDLGMKLPFEVALRGPALNWKLGESTVTEAGSTALALASSGQLNVTNLTGSLELEVPALNERLVNPLLAIHTPGQRLRSAQASMALKGELGAAGRQTWSLTTQSTNVVLVDTNNTALTPVLGTRASLEGVLAADERTFLLRRWEGQVFADGKPAGQLQATGDFHFDGHHARLSAKVSGVNEHALAPVAPLLLGDVQVARAEISADAEIDYEPMRPSRVLLGANLRSLEFKPAAGQLPESLRELELRLRADVASNRVDLTEGYLQTNPTPGWSNRVEVAGWLDFGKPAALHGDFAVKSPGFDLSPIYALVERRRPASTNAPPGVGDISTHAGATETGESTAARPVDRLDLALDIRQLKLRELVVSNWVANATVRADTVDLGLFSLRLGDAPVNARLQSTNVAGSAHYELAAEIEGLKTGPFLRSFYPAWEGQAEADVFAAIHLRGTANTGGSLWSGAAGAIHLGVTNANFQPLDRRWQNTLRPVGLLLQTPELFSTPVSWAHNRIVLTNHTLTLDRFTVISDAYVLTMDTTVPLAADFASSTIPRTPVNLYLSRNLITQLGFLKSGDTNQVTRYVQLPNFMHLGGTIAQPVLETDKLKLTGMTIGKAGDFVGGSAGDVLKKAGGVTEALGGIVSGRKFTGTEKEDANVVSRGIEGVFDAVGGLLGGTGKAVDRGTGALTGTKVADDVQVSRLAAFDWPRVFTNAPNVVRPPQ